MRALPYPLIAAVSDRRRLASSDGEACELLVAWAAAVARAGIDIIQLREHGLTDAALTHLVRRVVAATAGMAAAVVVNDRTDVALVTGCAGVHLPSTAPPAEVVRRITPGDFWIGRSVHDWDEPDTVARGCDYLTFGTVFSSNSKPAGHRVSGLEALQSACERAAVPVLAIGGVTVANAAAIAGTGAAGVAAIGLFTDGWSPRGGDDHVATVVEQLREAFARVGRG